MVIIDDDADILAVLAEVLREEGYDPVTFRDAQQAETYIVRHLPRLVITDLRLPEVSGQDLVLRLRERCNPGLPIVVMSGQTDGLPTARLPVQAYLHKPFDLDHLCTVVSQWARPMPPGCAATRGESGDYAPAW